MTEKPPYFPENPTMRALTALVRGSMLAAILAAAIPASPSSYACDRGMTVRTCSHCRAHIAPLPGATAISDPCCRYGSTDFPTAPAEMTSRPDAMPGGQTFVGAAGARGGRLGEPRVARAPSVPESRAAGPPGFLIGEILRL